MDHYLVSARKYRPTTFAGVVGQRALTATLKNAIATGHLAHSYLFCGSRGVGKTSCARIFAKTINCEHLTPEGEACNECRSCLAFNAGSSLNVVEMDAASNNSVNDMREVIKEVMVRPAMGRYRVFIIDEVHMLTSQAFNAFLKTLEEPPEYVIFILATTEKHKIIPTILSRCQIYDFNTISIRDIVEHLEMVSRAEGITAEPAALGVIARKADGAMRDALSIFDQMAASTRGNITYRATLENLNVLDSAVYISLTEAFLAGDILKSWIIYKDVRAHGFDSHFFINGLASFMRDLMVAREPSGHQLLDIDRESAEAIAAEAAKTSPDFLYKAMCLLNDADLNYRVSANKQFLVELTLAKICQLSRPASNSGHDGGQLKPIDRPQQAAPAPAPRQEKQPAPAAPAETPRQDTAGPRVTVLYRRPADAPSPHPTLRSVPLHGPSLKGPAVKPSADNRAPASNAGNRDNPYTPEALKSAWEAFMASHPTERILVNTMRMSRPRPTATPHAYTITVENDIQQELMNREMPAILAALRDSLDNDRITIAVDKSDGPGATSTWSEREVLAKMLETTPALKKFIEDLRLNIG